MGFIADQPAESRTFLTRTFTVFVPAAPMTIRAKDHSKLLRPKMITSHFHSPPYLLPLCHLDCVHLIVLFTAVNGYTSIFSDACDEMMKGQLNFSEKHLNFRQGKEAFSPFFERMKQKFNVSFIKPSQNGVSMILKPGEENIFFSKP